MQISAPIEPTHLAGRISTRRIMEGDTIRFDARCEALIERLDARMDELVGIVQESEMFRTLIDSGTPMEFIKLIMREIYLEIFSYQPQVIEATMQIIARMPKMDARTIKTMMMHQCDESDHGEMALRDYIALGGDEKFARSRRISPASFAVASLWWGLLHMETPAAYLGALYPFEGLTPRVCGPVVEMLYHRGFPRGAMEFIEFHATEDIKHTNLVCWLLKDVASRYPGAEDAIEAGLEYFLEIYPMPVWQTAYERAKAEWKADGADTIDRRAVEGSAAA